MWFTFESSTIIWNWLNTSKGNLFDSLTDVRSTIWMVSDDNNTNTLHMILFYLHSSMKNVLGFGYLAYIKDRNRTPYLTPYITDTLLIFFAFHKVG